MENRISAVIITLNEEKNIGRCLASLVGVADEIVVLDSGSSDKTEQICQHYGAIWASQNWLGYGAQKNAAIELATGPYILSLDADEALSPQLQAKIASLKQEKMAIAYRFNRLTNYCGHWIRHCGWYPDRKIRLWKKGRAEWTTPRVHETVVVSSGVKIVDLNANLLHYTYYSLSEHIAIANTYTTLVAEAYALRGKKASWFKLYLNPIFSFVRDYFLRRGILDGYYGFVICLVAAFSTFLKYAKLKQLLEQKAK